MNVYVRELSSALARAGVECDVYTRAYAADLPDVVAVEPGFNVHHVDAGPRRSVAKSELPGLLPEFGDGVLARMASSPADAIHA
ncbi:MAG: glycosyltransferase, partial [Actinobacteria bacterium]|nr:glycosyltransferase [Actinomycetota bacterium]